MLLPTASPRHPRLPTAQRRPVRRSGTLVVALGALSLLSACILPPPDPPSTSTSSTSSSSTSSTTSTSTTTTTEPGELGPVHIVLAEEPAAVVSPPNDTLVLRASVLTNDTNEVVSNQFVFVWSCSDSAGGQGCAAMTVDRHRTPNVASFALIHTVTYTVTLSAQQATDPLNSANDQWTFTSQAPL